MLTDVYCRFTSDLCDSLSPDPRVIGIVALGSTAEKSHLPDVYSDHDLFVVVTPGEQETFRSNLSWLPDSTKIVFSYRDTPHGVKVLYESGHLVEMAVFDPEELHLARVNDYRVLLDRGGVVDAMLAVEAATRRWIEASRHTQQVMWGDFIGATLLAASRSARGETMSARWVLLQALGSLVKLIRGNIPSRHPELLDDLDEYRRFERAYPSLGSEIDTMLEWRTDVAARLMTELVTRELKTSPDYPAAAVNALLARLRAIEAGLAAEQTQIREETWLDPYDAIDVFQDA